MSQMILKMRKYNEIIEMIKMFFVFFAGASGLFIVSLLIELVA